MLNVFKNILNCPHHCCLIVYYYSCTLVNKMFQVLILVGDEVDAILSYCFQKQPKQPLTLHCFTLRVFHSSAPFSLQRRTLTMLNLHTRSPVLQPPCTPLAMFSRNTNRFPPFSTVGLHFQGFSAQPGEHGTSVFVAKAGRGLRLKTQKASDGEEDKDGGFVDIDFEVAAESEDGFPGRTGFGGREEEKDFDRDPEFAEIMGDCLDDPEKARSKVIPFFWIIWCLCCLELLRFKDFF